MLRHVLPGATDLLRPPAAACLALARALQEPPAQVGGASAAGRGFRGGMGREGGGTSCLRCEVEAGLPALGVKGRWDFLPKV